MYLREMRLIQQNGEIIRKVAFHSGTNFIVDEEKSDSHNHVGKTTFLKLIDIAFGSRDKKSLYYDAQTNTENAILRNLINNQKVSVELNICEGFTSDSSDDTRLKVDLFDRGHKYINGERKKEGEYNDELNTILFGDEDGKPTFRQLIPYFVRVSARKDDYDFLKNLHATTPNTTYHKIYNYLFNISTSEDFNKLEKAKKLLNQSREAERNYKNLDNNNQNREVLFQKITALRERQKLLQSQVSDLVGGTDFVKNRDQITKARKKYVAMMDELNNLSYRLERVNDDLENTKSDPDLPRLNLDLTEKFFKEIKQSIPEVDKDYQDLLAFNNALKSNKVSYLSNLQESLRNDMNNKKQVINQFLNENQNIISLVENDDISKYDQLNDELTETNQKIAKQEEIYETLEKYAQQEQRLSEQVESLKKKVEESSKNYQGSLNTFNRYFTNLASEINGIEPILAYHESSNEFPVSIEDLDEGTSSGTRKSLMICYDIAYQQFASEIGKQVPNFIVHDVLESVEGNVIQKLVNKINSLNIQVVVAILQEKLDSSQIPDNEQEEATILKLSTTDRLFEPSELER